jgi:3-keto-L-gulonate-6-phosphate decarboxylase
MADIEELTKEEKELLKLAAAGGGEFLNISDVDKIPGPGIFVKYGRNLFDTKDPVAVAKYLEAFKSLMKRGMVSEAGEKKYQLTGPGWEKARSLRQEG